jgi:hypothetical protein
MVPAPFYALKADRIVENGGGNNPIWREPLAASARYVGDPARRALRLLSFVKMTIRSIFLYRMVYRRVPFPTKIRKPQDEILMGLGLRIVW